MADYMQTTRVFGNPIALGHRPNAKIANAIAAHLDRDPDSSFTTMDGLSHEHWLIDGKEARELCDTFDDVLYVTDGHHRLAAHVTQRRIQHRTMMSLRFE